MMHARYYEPAAQLYRAAMRGHYVSCEECGRRVCGDYAQTVDYGEDVACRFHGDDCDGGTTYGGRVFCAYCH